MFYVGFYYSSYSGFTHQVARVTSDGQEMSGPRGVTPDDGVYLAALLDAPHTLAVADVDALVHADGQTLGEGESGLSGRAPVTTSGKYFNWKTIYQHGFNWNQTRMCRCRNVSRLSTDLSSLPGTQRSPVPATTS